MRVEVPAADGTHRRAPKGPRVWVRLLAAPDRELYRALYGSPDVMRAIAPALSVSQADAQFKRVLAHQQSIHPGHRTWAIGLSDAPAAPVGLAALLRCGARAEFGIILHPSTWRCGVATRALELLLPLAFGRMGLEFVDASRPNDDHAQIIDRMFAPLGFERAAGLRPGEVGWCLSKARWSRDRSMGVGDSARHGAPHVTAGLEVAVPGGVRGNRNSNGVR